MAKNIKSKKIEVTEIIDNSIKVNFTHSPRMAGAVDELITLDNKTYRQIIRLAKSYRKSNALAEKLFGEKAEIKFTGSFEIVSKLISLEAGSFKKAVKCARKYRHANKLMDLAEDNYKELQNADNAFVNQKMSAVYA